MPTLADSLLSSSARALAIRKRPDLDAQRQRYHGKTYWVVKDPVGMHYFRFQEEEYAILQMLDGEKSLDQIRDDFEAQFPPQKITLEELQQFLGMLHRSGLVVAGVPGQGVQLRKRRTERQRKELLAAVSNILSIRFKGIDPERFLSWFYPYVRWCFSPIAVGVWLVAVISAGLLIATEFDKFQAKLPGFYQFFSPTNALLLFVTLGITKVLHELGHGLSCKHFGGECHELGVMILVLTPCLYCNVSDSWMLPNKWHRAAIGAAGMYVELFLASLAAWVWWFSEPGLMNNLCLNVMFICSVSTLIFNGNPLLRYDGYYILADVMEIPNLRQKATQILSRKAAEWFLGLEPQEDPFLPQRNQMLFVLYSVAAAVYRWVVVFAILWFLYRVWKPYRLEIIGEGIMCASLYGLFVMPVYQAAKFFYVPGRLDKVKKPRMYLSMTGLALLLGFVFFVPLPYHVIATLEVQAWHPSTIYVEVPGRLAERRVEARDVVGPHAVLARLVSTDLDIKIAELEAQKEEADARLRSLDRQRFHDPQARSEIPGVRETLASVSKQLQEKLKDQGKLTLVADVAGTVLPPPWTNHPTDPEVSLPSWTGTPLLRENMGAYLEEGVLFCQIGDPKRMEALLVIDQDDIEFVEKGQEVKIKLDALPLTTFQGKIEAVSQSDLRIASRRMSTKAKGELATKTGPTGAEVPQSTSYQASVPLDNEAGILEIGERGRAKVYMDRAHWQTLARRAWRLVFRTFNFRM
jgi:putative peptide zinc metalloprotease protein